MYLFGSIPNILLLGIQLDNYNKTKLELLIYKTSY